MKPKLLSVRNHDTLLKLGCDCGVCFLNTLEAKTVKNEVGQKNLLELRFGLLEDFIGCGGSLVIVGWSIGIQLT